MGEALTLGWLVIRFVAQDRIAETNLAFDTPDAHRALKFIVLLGIVSLFADVTYEGARSGAGPFLATLGASALIVSLVSGGGELVGYALRLWSGRLADRTQRYWAITFAVLLVPALAALSTLGIA